MRGSRSTWPRMCAPTRKLYICAHPLCVATAVLAGLAHAGDGPAQPPYVIRGGCPKAFLLQGEKDQDPAVNNGVVLPETLTLPAADALFVVKTAK